MNRRRAKGINAKSEMEEQKPVELEKMEEFGVDCLNGVIQTDGMSHSAFNSAEGNPTKKDPTKQYKSGEGMDEYAEGMACSGDFGRGVVSSPERVGSRVVSFPVPHLQGGNPQ
ncbi:hypothetical protein BLNAU_22745 [Blattamonas nauphoetae]|uniref:Uncharacterized protein n=1 Tax=Blattamonas nauphoetae TaxID=2049346 RepID=A0ABQ9WSQ2_9EUKA|nr:hypothetical protein BLNAU_22745 [Blattamonas nauphoetae]